MIEKELAKAHAKEQLKELLKTQGLIEVDEKQHQVAFTEAGKSASKTAQGSRPAQGRRPLRHRERHRRPPRQPGAKAHKLFQRDRDYIVKDSEVVIIDEFTGRMMPGRRYSEGLHQALEAKEHATIQPENQTLASITFQNYFRLYDKLAGMTGTAVTEADEFLDIYKLDVIEIPTNVPVGRADLDDEVYRTGKEKWEAIIADIESASSATNRSWSAPSRSRRARRSRSC